MASVSSSVGLLRVNVQLVDCWRLDLFDMVYSLCRRRLIDSVTRVNMCYRGSACRDQVRVDRWVRISMSKRSRAIIISSDDESEECRLMDFHFKYENYKETNLEWDRRFRMGMEPKPLHLKAVMTGAIRDRILHAKLEAENHVLLQKMYETQFLKGSEIGISDYCMQINFEKMDLHHYMLLFHRRAIDHYRGQFVDTIPQV